MTLWSSVLHTAELLHLALLPFLAIGGSLLALLLAGLVIQRGVRELAWRRRQKLVTRYQSVIDTIVQADAEVGAIAGLRRSPLAHRAIVADLLLTPLRVARGDVVARVRAAATEIGLIPYWHLGLQDRRWWRRAAAVRALGAIADPSALPGIMRALDDEHEEVRAAAVEAAGGLGDPAVIPALLEHLADGSRYQRTRIVDALRSLGPPVTPALVAFARAHPARTQLAADVLGMIGTSVAVDPLIEWSGDASSDVRVAVLGALGSIGLDDRSYYFALRGLGDSDPRARAMAARALGRSRREDAAGYLAERLDDEWLPAAEAAGALRRLGEPGAAALQARARHEGQAGDLARQMLWRRPAAAARA